MQLIPQWRRTLTHGYSAHAIYLSIAIGFAEKCLPYVTEVIPWWLSIAVLALALVVRIIKQETVSGTVSDEVLEDGE
jgi:hypothetical protein